MPPKDKNFGISSGPLHSPPKESDQTIKSEQCGSTSAFRGLCILFFC